MIYYIVTAKHSYTMESYLQTWGRALLGRVQLLFYEELPKMRQLPFGTYIFSDLERLTPTQKGFAAHVWDQLSVAGQGVRLLNHPSQAVLRYALLKELYRSGKNCFQAVRASESRDLSRFPVFIREENEHNGSLTSLLQSPKEVEQALMRLVKQGHSLDDLLLVEYCDTADATGLFTKYAAFMVAGQIVPRTVIFGRDWVLKTADLGTPEMLELERCYREKNPHEGWLREIFSLAKIDYGRIDYGLLGDKPQVWEINTNPMVLLLPKEYKPVHVPAQKEFARSIRAAFEAIDSKKGAVEGIQVSTRPEMVRELPDLPPARSLRRFVRKVKNKVLVRPNVRVLTPRWQVRNSDLRIAGG